MEVGQNSKVFQVLEEPVGFRVCPALLVLVMIELGSLADSGGRWDFSGLKVISLFSDISAQDGSFHVTVQRYRFLLDHCFIFWATDLSRFQFVGVGRVLGLFAIFRSALEMMLA